MNNEDNKPEMPEKAEMTVVDNNRDMTDAAINKVENLLNANDKTHTFTVDSVKGDKTPATLCYIPFVALFFMLNRKKINNNYFIFHINQGLIVTAIWVFSMILSAILKSLFNNVDDYTHTTPGFVYLIICICFSISVLLSLFGLVNTYEGKSKELPIVGKFRFMK